MMRFILAFALLAGCVDLAGSSDVAGVDECGPMPARPIIEVTHDNWHATLSNAAWVKVTTYESAVEAWMVCKGGAPDSVGVSVGVVDDERAKSAPQLP